MNINSYYILNDGSLHDGLYAAELFMSPFFGGVVNITQEKPMRRISGMNICFQREGSNEWRAITTDMIHTSGLIFEVNSFGIAKSRNEAIKRCDVALMHLKSKLIRDNS